MWECFSYCYLEWHRFNHVWSAMYYNSRLDFLANNVHRAIYSDKPWPGNMISGVPSKIPLRISRPNRINAQFIRAPLYFAIILYRSSQGWGAQGDLGAPSCQRSSHELTLTSNCRVRLTLTSRTITPPLVVAPWRCVSFPRSLLVKLESWWAISGFLCYLLK